MAKLTIPLLGTLVLACAIVGVNAQQPPLELIDRNHPAIAYARPSNDSVATLLQSARASSLAAGERAGYLAAILRALDVPVSSQMLVFSKGSVQSPIIEAGNPRALYFNDSVVVGWVRGGFVEIAAQDPRQGSVFYRATPAAGGVSIARSDDCLRCHHSARTAGVAGLIEPMSHSRPLQQRWGGWYVTGTAGSIQHFGNVDVAALTSGAPAPRTPTLASLEHTFDITGYLTPYSDIAALMVFEHQMQMMNLLTRLGWETRIAQDGTHSGTMGAAFQEIVHQTADYMLFIDEASIPGTLVGSSGFAEDFSRRGPRDPKGRSLRQLDLTTRLLRYPCSYMIYSSQFEQLPAAAKGALYGRIWTILSGNEGGRRYKRLSPSDRRAIVEILRATKSDLPAYFRQ